MPTLHARRLIALVPAALLIATITPFADEGMWTFDNLPRAALKAKYGFEPSQAWLDHLRLSSVRFNDGGSGSFVSPRGLVMTNHHVALGQLQKLSTDKKNYARDGFFAPTPADELKCPDLELNVLVAMEDVTRRVTGAAKAEMPAAAALEARKGAIAAIEKESLDKTGLRSDVVTLYSGGEYLALSVQALHRRPHRLCAGAADRILRRRSRQLHLPALQPRRHALPCVRERQAGRERALSHVEREGRRGGRARLRLGSSRIHPAAPAVGEAADRAGPHAARHARDHRAPARRTGRVLGARGRAGPTEPGARVQLRERQESVHW